jgi:hypothetical protein
VVRNELLVHRAPYGDAYADVKRFVAGDVVSPLADVVPDDIVSRLADRRRWTSRRRSP